MYTKKQVKRFKEKDLKIHKSGIVKSFIEKTGELPTKDFLDEAIVLIYTFSEEQEKLLDDMVEEETKVERVDPEETPF